MEQEPFNVLIYGGSNVWGYDPDSPYRYPFKERWVTKLKDALVKSSTTSQQRDVQIIQEGMNGRTTMYSKQKLEKWDHDRNGRLTLKQVLHSHKPLELVILFLGTNDFNLSYRHHCTGDGDNAVVNMVLTGIRTLVEDIRSVGTAVGNNGKCPEIMVLGAPAMTSNQLNRSWNFPDNLEILGKMYNDALEIICSEIGVQYVNITEVTSVSPTDGIHLRLQDQEPLAKLMEMKICERLSSINSEIWKAKVECNKDIL